MIVVRPATEAERGLIIDSWCRSFGPEKANGWAGDPFMVFRMDYASSRDGKVAPNVWFQMHRSWIAEYARTVLVAAHDSLPDEALGWLAYDNANGHVRLHYAWVRKDARRHGVASKLLQAAGVAEADEVRASFMTKDGRRLLETFFGREAAA